MEMRGDPLDVPRILSDAAELLCHEIISDEENRTERCAQLNYFLDRLGGNLRYGRLYCFTVLASVMFDICGRDAYPIFRDRQEASGVGVERRSGRQKETGTEGGDGEELGGSQPIHEDFASRTPLSEFTADKWELVLSDLESVRDALLRRDATRDTVPREIPGWDSDSDDGEESMESGEAEEEDGRVNEALAKSALFAENYKDVVNAFRYQQCFSFLRTALEDEVIRAKDEGRDTLHIEAKDLKSYEEFISKHFEEGHGIRDCLESILIKGDTKNPRTRSAGIALKPAADVREIIRSKNFDLVRFQKKIQIILQKWYDAVLPRPVLAKLGYGKMALPPVPKRTERHDSLAKAGEDDQVASGEDKAVKEGRGRSPPRPGADSENDYSGAEAADAAKEVTRDRKRRGAHSERESPSLIRIRSGRSPQTSRTPSKVGAAEDLREKLETLVDNAVDPLGECLAKASEAATKTTHDQNSVVAEPSDSDELVQHQPRTPPMQREKKSKLKHKIQFNDSDSEGEDQRVTLSEVPERAHVRGRNEQSSSNSKPSPVSAKRVQVRRRFTETEDAAIRIGVERFGYGRWAKIKDYYREELRARTSVQIKDRYRTLMKKNSV